MHIRLLPLLFATALLGGCSADTWKNATRNVLIQKECRDNATNDGDRYRCIHEQDR